MNKEDKELLFKDLCARLPYHVKVKVWLKDGTTEEGLLDLEHNYADVLLDAFYYNKISEIKPYLRPLSSITKEEKKEINNITSEFGDRWFDSINPTEKWNATFWHHSKIIDYLNSIHVDYRGLIEKGLAISVTKENNPYN